MKFICVFALVSSFIFEAHAAKEFTKTLNKYASAESIEVGLKETDEKSTLGTKSISEGTLKFAKSKIYILLNGDKKIEFFYKNKTIWLVEYPDLDFDKNGKRKVTVIKKSTPALISGLINLFSDQKQFLKEFKVLSEKKDGDKLTVEFKPTQKNLKSFTLVIAQKERLIQQVLFTDDVDTKTALDLSDLKLNKKVQAADFEFKKLKSDEVTNQ